MHNILLIENENTISNGVLDLFDFDSNSGKSKLYLLVGTHTNLVKNNDYLPIQNTRVATNNEINNVFVKEKATVKIPIDLNTINKDSYDKILKKYNIDLVVLVQPDNTNDNSISFKKIAFASSTPTLIIPSNFHCKKITNTILVFDFEENINIPFAKIADIANLLSTPLEIIYFNTLNQNHNLELIKASMSSLKENYSTYVLTSQIINAKSIEEGVLALTKNDSCNVIAFITHETTRIPLLSTSFTQHIMGKLSHPMLLVNIL